MALVDGPVKAVEVDYGGKDDAAPRPVLMAAVEGLLSGMSVEPVSLVNALLIAEERGIRHARRTGAPEPGFETTVGVTLEAAGGWGGGSSWASRRNDFTAPVSLSAASASWFADDAISSVEALCSSLEAAISCADASRVSVPWATDPSRALISSTRARISPAIFAISRPHTSFA